MLAAAVIFRYATDAAMMLTPAAASFRCHMPLTLRSYYYLLPALRRCYAADIADAYFAIAASAMILLRHMMLFMLLYILPRC